MDKFSTDEMYTAIKQYLTSNHVEATMYELNTKRVKDKSYLLGTLSWGVTAFDLPLEKNKLEFHGYWYGPTYDYADVRGASVETSKMPEVVFFYNGFPMGPINHFTSIDDFKSRLPKILPVSGTTAPPRPSANMPGGTDMLEMVRETNENVKKLVGVMRDFIGIAAEAMKPK